MFSNCQEDLLLLLLLLLILLNCTDIVHVQFHAQSLLNMTQLQIPKSLCLKKSCEEDEAVDWNKHL